MFDLTQFVTAGLVIGIRISALMTFTPFPGSPAVPMKVKAGLALAITALLYPVYGHALPSLESANVAGLVVSELGIGLLTGLTVTFIFEAAQMAGHLMGMQVGFSLVNIIDPQTQVETPVLSTLHQFLVMLIFLRLDVHHWMLRGVANSFNYLPAGSVQVSGAVVNVLLHGAGGIWLVAIEIAAPILFATMLADTGLAFIGKASPQFHIMLLGMPVKTILASTVWISAVALWPGRFESYFSRAVQSSEQLLHLAR